MSCSEAGLLSFLSLVAGGRFRPDAYLTVCCDRPGVERKRKGRYGGRERQADRVEERKRRGYKGRERGGVSYEGRDRQVDRGNERKWGRE